MSNDFEEGKSDGEAVSASPRALGRPTPIRELTALVLELVEVIRGAGTEDWDGEWLNDRLGNDVKPGLEQLLRRLRS